MLPKLDKQIIRERIARRIALEFSEGEVVNLGIGIPTLVPDYIPKGTNIILQTENGALGVGPPPEVPDLKCIDAGGRMISLLPGGSFFASDTSFGLIRGGHVDATVLGALEVDQDGNLANWMIPGRSVPGMGGAMDLAAGVKRVYIATAHVTKKGEAKILRRCKLPLTAVGVVKMIVTEFAVFEMLGGVLTLLEIAPEVTPEMIREHTEADYATADTLGAYKGIGVM